MIISVVIAKGGVGKTTTVVNLAAEYSLHGKRLLVVDMDAQGNCTSSLTGRNQSEFNGSAVFDMLRAYGIQPLGNFVHETTLPGVDIIPSTAMTEQLVDQLPILAKIYNKPKHAFLAECLRPLEEHYDAILIDTPPARSILVASSLYSSDYVIIPLKPEQYCLDSIGRTVSGIQELNLRENLNIKILGVLLTIVEDRTSLTKSIRGMLQNGPLSEHLFKAEIRKSQAVNESTVFKKPLVLYKPSCEVKQDFDALYEEIMGRVGM